MTRDTGIDPATGIFRNLLGISDPVELAEVERDLTSAALFRLERQHLPGAYDLDHLCAFHRVIFGDLYPWAGEVRSVAIAKTDLFALPQHIRPYAAALFDRLATEQRLQRLDRGSFIERLAHYFGEVNALHPFREGNGRAQRAFFSQLAAEAGWYLDWSLLRSDENVAASIASMHGDDGPLIDMLARMVSREAGVGTAEASA